MDGPLDDDWNDVDAVEVLADAHGLVAARLALETRGRENEDGDLGGGDLVEERGLPVLAHVHVFAVETRNACSETNIKVIGLWL